MSRAWRHLAAEWAGALAIATLSAEFAALPARAVATVGPDDVGRSFERQITVAQRQLPLPEGAWTLVEVAAETVDPVRFGAYGVIYRLVLVKPGDGALDAIAVVHANAIPIDKGWGLAQDCNSPDAHFVRIYEAGDKRANCAFVKSVAVKSVAVKSVAVKSVAEKTVAEKTVASPAAPVATGAWPAVVAAAGRHGWNLPAILLESGFRLSDRQDVLDVRYYFNPQTSESPFRSADHESADAWSPQRLASNAAAPDALPTNAEPAGGVAGLLEWATALVPGRSATPAPRALDQGRILRRKYVDEIVRWTQSARPLVLAGFKGAGTDLPILPMPGQWLGRGSDMATAIRTRRLEAARGADTITATQYRGQLATLVHDPDDAATAEMSDVELSLWKLLSSRLINTTTSLGINYIFIGDIYTATGLQLLSSSLHSGINYMEELLWNQYGPQRRPKAAVVDFRYLGNDN